jgi:hypothetical protein
MKIEDHYNQDEDCWGWLKCKSHSLGRILGFKCWVIKFHIDYVWEECWIYKRDDSLT